MLDLTRPFLERGEKLICFGDSLTAPENSYVKFLRDALPDNTVINAGRPGDKTPWALTRFDADVLQQKPDAVSIMLGTNDSIVGRGCWADEPTVSAEAYRCNLVWMIHLCRLNGIKKVSIASVFGLEGPAFLAYGTRTYEYGMAARDAADEMKCPFVPLDTLFVTLRGATPLTELALTREGIHPQAQYHEDIARAMLKAWNLPDAALSR